MGLLGGIGRVLKSPLTNHKANKIIKLSKARYSEAEDQLEAARYNLQHVMENVGKKKLDIADKLLKKVEKKLSEIRGNLNFSEKKVAHDEQLSFEENTLPALKNTSMSAGEILSTGLTMGGTGTAAFAGSVGLVGTFATASTGTAISTLSGAAATNATLAWFGGGAIAAGGAGMAVGAVVLGGIAVFPVLVIGAIKFASYAEKKLTAAEEFSAQVDVAVEQISACIETITALEKHFIQFETVLDMIAGRLDKALKKLVAQKKRGVSSDKLERNFFACVLLTKSLKRLLEINLMTPEGMVSEESRQVVQHAKYLQDEDPEKNQVVDSILLDKKVERPKGVNKIAQIKPGQDSVKYFWMYKKETFSWKMFLLALLVIYCIIQICIFIF